MAQDGKKLNPPELGAYRYGTMTGAVFAPSKFKHHEVKLVGDWETEGLGYWYAPWKAATALAQAGLLHQQPGDGKKFSAVTGHRFCIYRQTGEGDAHDWSVIAYDEQGEQVKLGSFPDPVEPQAAQAAAAPPPPQAAPPPPPTSGTAGTTGPGPRPTNGEEKARRDRNLVAQVDVMLGISLAIAAYRHVQVARKPLADLDEGAVQDSSACVMIRLEHLGYDPSTDRSPAYRKRLRRLEHSIDPERCPLLPGDVKAAEEEKSESGPAPASTAAGEALDLDQEDDLPF